MPPWVRQRRFHRLSSPSYQRSCHLRLLSARRLDSAARQRMKCKFYSLHLAPLYERSRRTELSRDVGLPVFFSLPLCTWFFTLLPTSISRPWRTSWDVISAKTLRGLYLWKTFELYAFQGLYAYCTIDLGFGILNAVVAILLVLQAWLWAYFTMITFRAFTWQKREDTQNANNCINDAV